MAPSARRISDWRWPSAWRMSCPGALLDARHCLPAHRLDQVGRRHDVLDLDPVDLETPGRDRGIDHAQQALVDLVAMRQHLVEVHGAHHRTDVGHGQHDDRLGEIGDLVARLGGVEHLEEGDAVDRHGGVVLGDHFLFGNVDHLLHHIHLATDPIEIGNDQVQTRRQRAGVFAEPLDGPVKPLRHSLHAGEQRDDDEQHQNNRENIETAHISSKAGKNPSRAVIGRDRDPTGSAVASNVGIHAILHKSHGERTVTIMYLRRALESVQIQT